MADLEHITAEGETYDISDATARTDISALQTENAELKAQIAEMEEEISELNSDLTLVNIDDYVSMNSGTLTLSSAYYKSGWVHLHLYGQLTDTTSSGIEICTVQSPYRPKPSQVIGQVGYTGSVNDNGTVLYARIESSGVMTIRITSAQVASSRYSFSYPTE